MTTGLLPAEADRYWRHQLGFEVGAAVMLAAVTGRSDLVGLVGAICLPAVRSTWVHWVRGGVGLLPAGVAMALASSSGLLAVVAVWALACTVGIVRRGRQAQARRHLGAGRASAGAEDEDLIGLGEADGC